MDQLTQYLPVLMLGFLAVAFSAGMIVASVVLGRWANRNRLGRVPAVKNIAYECGMLPVGEGNTRLSVKFYLVAMLFILFDIEVVFLWSWMATYKEWVAAGDPAALYSFWAIMIYMFLWFLGDAYVIRSGALQWEESETLDYESREEADLKVAV